MQHDMSQHMIHSCQTLLNWKNVHAIMNWTHTDSVK